MTIPWLHILISEPFLSTLQKVIFTSGCKYFSMLDVIFCLLKNYHPMQKMMSVYKFGQEILAIGTFCHFL